jgi:hypothetical protein
VCDASIAWSPNSSRDYSLWRLGADGRLVSLSQRLLHTSQLLRLSFTWLTYSELTKKRDPGSGASAKTAALRRVHLVRLHDFNTRSRDSSPSRLKIDQKSIPRVIRGLSYVDTYAGGALWL